MGTVVYLPLVVWVINGIHCCYFGPLTGAHVNPAVTIDFWEVSKFPTELVLVYIIAQCIGAFIVALIVWLLFKDHLDEEENQNCQLGSFATIASNSNNFEIYFLK